MAEKVKAQEARQPVVKQSREQLHQQHSSPHPAAVLQSLVRQPAALSHSDLLALQPAIGNQALISILRSHLSSQSETPAATPAVRLSTSGNHVVQRLVIRIRDVPEMVGISKPTIWKSIAVWTGVLPRRRQLQRLQTIRAGSQEGKGRSGPRREAKTGRDKRHSSPPYDDHKRAEKNME